MFIGKHICDIEVHSSLADLMTPEGGCKETYVFYLELTAEVARVFVYVAFFFILFTYYSIAYIPRFVHVSEKFNPPYQRVLPSTQHYLADGRIIPRRNRGRARRQANLHHLQRRHDLRPAREEIAMRTSFPLPMSPHVARTATKLPNMQASYCRKAWRHTH